MDALEQQVLAARTNEQSLNELVESQRQWILRCASEGARHSVTESDDEWSVALLAFMEAVQSFQSGKGAFKAFASVVIKRRVKDYLRSEHRNNSMVYVSPDVFTGGTLPEEEASGVNIQVQQQMAADATAAEEETTKAADAREEIASMQKILGQYGFSFYDLTDCSPKAEKTKQSCAAAVEVLLRSEELRGQMRKTKTLPMKQLSADSGVSKKILDRHRKYIIAATEILAGDYPSLRPYMSFITKRMQDAQGAGA